MFRKIITAVFALTIMLAVSAGAAEKFPMLWLNNAAPDFTLQDQNGKKVTLSSFKDKSAVVVIFWHPENAGSVTQLKELKKLLDEKKLAKDVKVLAITFGKEVKQRDAAVKKAEDAGLGFTILFEKREDATATNVDYQIAWIPAIYVISKKGELSSPMLTNVTDKSGGKTFEQTLRDAVRGKDVNACSFLPQHREEEKDYKKLYDMIGKPAPDFIDTDDKGKKQAPGYFRGFKNLVVVFWSPGCPHCRRELPQVSSYYKRFSDKQDVEILSVMLGGKDEKSRAAAKEFFKMYGIKFPILFNEDGKIDQAYNVNSVPIAFFIDKKGIVREVFIGEVSLAGDMFRCAAAKLK